jgi:hypothetical protein
VVDLSGKALSSLEAPAISAAPFAAELPSFYGLWSFSKSNPPKELLLYLSQKPAVTKLVDAWLGYDLPAFKTMHCLDIWKTVGPPVGTVYGIRRVPTSRLRSLGRRRAGSTRPTF